MADNIVKVYGEDLLFLDIDNTPEGVVTGDPVNVGDTQGALCINFIAVDECNLSTAIPMTILHSDTLKGPYTELTSFQLTSGKAYLDNDLVQVFNLPAETKAYIKVSANNIHINAGYLRICLGYLPR